MRCYCLSHFELETINDEFGKHSLQTSHFEYCFVTWLESVHPQTEHAFNTSKQRRYLKMIPDAVVPLPSEQVLLYFAHGCRM